MSRTGNRDSRATFVILDGQPENTLEGEMRVVASRIRWVYVTDMWVTDLWGNRGLQRGTARSLQLGLPYWI